MSVVEPKNDFAEHRQPLTTRTKGRTEVVYTSNGLKRVKIDMKNGDCQILGDILNGRISPVNDKLSKRDGIS